MRIASYADNLKATENCIQGLHQPPSHKQMDCTQFVKKCLVCVYVEWCLPSLVNFGCLHSLQLC